MSGTTQGATPATTPGLSPALDNWLSQGGIDVQRRRNGATRLNATTTTTTTPIAAATTAPATPPRPGQASASVQFNQAAQSAYQRALATAQSEVDFTAAEQAIAGAKPNGEVALFGGGYAEAAAAHAKLVAAGDHMGAIDALQRKKVAAQRVLSEGARKWDADTLIPGMEKAIADTNRLVTGKKTRGIGERIANNSDSAGKRFKTAIAEFLAAKEEYPKALAAARDNPADDALYEKGAWQALVAVKQASDKISEPREALETLDNNKKLLKEAKAIAKKAQAGKANVGPEMDDKLAAFQEARTKCNDDLSRGDGGTWKQSVNAVLKLAREIYTGEHKRAIDGWVDRQSPADKQQLDAVGRVAFTSWKPESIETQARDMYTDAMADGQPLGKPGRKGDRIELTPAQAMAIHAYSGPAYAVMNEFLRDPPAGPLSQTQQDVKALVEAAAEALNRLPEYDAFPVYRWEKPYQDAAKGIDYMRTRYQVGKEFEIKEFWSSGATGGAAPDAAKPTAEIVITGKKKGSNGRAVSQMSYYKNQEGGGEILFRPGTKFRTTKVVTSDAAGKPVKLGQGYASGGELLTIELMFIIHVVEV
jgi:hypothetical protein